MLRDARGVMGMASRVFGKMREFEWPTLIVLGATYLVWLSATTLMAEMSLALAIPVLAVAIAQYSSLQHEMIHGHPFKKPRWNAAIVFPSLLPVIPYARFRDLHLAHHRDSDLTDPFDDPESNYLSPYRWSELPSVARLALNANNTLLGRLTLGPAIGTGVFLWSEFRLLASDRAVRRAWLLHVPAVAVVGFWLFAVASLPAWAYAVACYAALSLLRIRTFLEHQAHERVRGRTVIIDECGPLAFLFLMNNFHVVHHMHPRVPWYRLPKLFRANRSRYLRFNDGYFYRSYAEVFRLYFLRRKDPVPHPLLTHD